MFEIEPKDFHPHMGFYSRHRIQYPSLNEPVKWLVARGLKQVTYIRSGYGYRAGEIRLDRDEFFLGCYSQGAIIGHNIPPPPHAFRRQLVVIADQDIAFEFRVRWS